MFKKFLAALTTLALSLGMVALTAGPASAHHSTITAAVVCTSPTTATITWSVQNWNGGKVARVQSSTGNLVPALTEFASDETKQYTQSITATGTYNLSVTMKWWDGDSWENQTTNSGSIQVKSSHFTGCALPDDTDDKIEICHATASGSNPYTSPEVSKSSIITNDPNGHGPHSGDIIPAFDYVKQGVPGHYAGKNWDAYGQAVYAAGCALPDVTPAAPTFTNAQCTGPGTFGQASYTIPGTANVSYTVSINDGAWNAKSAGTYFVNVGTKVEVHAAAASGYELEGTDDWSKTFTTPDCEVTVTPTKPASTQPVCVADEQVGQGGYTIPAIAGVTYEKSGNGSSGWTAVAAGTHLVADGTVVWIRAVELAGYELAGNDGDYKWKFEFDGPSAPDCDVPVAPAPTQQLCTGPGTSSQASYTIPSESGIEYQTWNGAAWVEIAAGVYPVNAFPAEVEIRAVADGSIIVPGSVTEWTFVFASAGDCLVDAEPVEPAWTDAMCEVETTGATQGTFEVVAAANVAYEKSTDGGTTWTPVSSGIHNATAGDAVVIRALAAPGYQLTGDTGPWSHTFGDPGDCLDAAVVGDPAFADSVCDADTTGATQATYEIVAVTGVTYEISFDGVSYTTAGASAGLHDATPGTHIWIKALALPGYEITGQTVWDHAFTDPGECLDEAPVQPVVGVHQECVVDDLETGAAHYESGTVTIPAAAHVTYSVDGVVTAAGEHDVAPGSYAISAEADPGYALTGVPDPWVVEVLAAEPCGQLVDLPVVDPVVTFVQTTCVSSGGYTLAVEPLEESAGVIWTVSGGLPNTVGTHTVTTAGKVVVTATPAAGYGFSGSEPVLQWSFDFTAPADDCLPTLALTGGSVAAGGLGLTALLAIGGILLVAARRRDAAES
jgi:hypothetical protein